jgi:hypothetical protein
VRSRARVSTGLRSSTEPVAAGLIPNTQAAYKTLSNKTAKARRQGAFPDLIDRTRRIHRDRRFQSPAAALAWLADSYRRDGTAGQRVSLYLGVEKDGMVTQLAACSDDLGLPILALGVTSPREEASFRDYNAGKPYPEQVRPWNFLSLARIRPRSSGRDRADRRSSSRLSSVTRTSGSQPTGSTAGIPALDR